MKTKAEELAILRDAHTPGPWHILPQVMDADTERHAKVCNPYAFRRHIATHPDLDDDACRIVCDMRDGPEGDACLISAAPDLLDELETAVRRVEMANAEGNSVLSAWLPGARAAIARAKGGA